LRLALQEKAMDTVTIHNARAKLSQLVARVEAGEEIILARGKDPVAKLVPFQAPAGKRCFGALRGVVSVGAAFFDPLAEAELTAWE
jgi:prevent-host-death family protein